MKARLSFPHWRHLQLPLLAALALNGLLLLPALRPSQRPVASRAAVTADDTPELLRFSRQQAREPSLPLLALPSLSSLPPPPPTDLPAEPRSGAASRGRGNDTHGGRPKDPVATATAAERGAAQDRPLSRAGAEPTAATTLLALALQARPVEPSEATALAGLWEQATATGESPGGMVVPADGLEWRRLPLAKARAAGLPFSDPIAVVSGGKLLLLWPEGTAFWMLAAAGSSKTVSPTP
ncbi:hypothetical protein [Cyanobium sp. N5-Cardenillas]|uniref:hypothetical protein n=1 Tax=Cyanobium sp. N5-Cardenillas TaxID=2823720 RepID=UPI0020CBEA59|nr:hypothetical protein [Cyanobium sp. N5-Cardenillas]MCP9785040.1 hypothetical protein [Cyanobium sp. N5-Cardenillas]